MGRIAKFAVVAFGAIFITGLFYAGFGILERWMMRGEAPQGTWWQWLIAIPIIGIVALALELMSEGVRHAFGADQRGAPRWREYLAIVTMLSVIGVILVIYNLLR